jgi:hypothetical protein
LRRARWGPFGWPRADPIREFLLDINIDIDIDIDNRQAAR